MQKIDSNWTLFLDRDGVISKELPNVYVRSWNHFQFIENTFEAFKILSPAFKRIIIITNQRGVGLNLMSVKDLENIHQNMIGEIKMYGGRVDKIYYCTDADRENSLCRKPKPAMALWAKKDFPEINFLKSIMIGNSESDMKFGKNLEMKTVFIKNEKNVKECKLIWIDYIYSSLFEFAAGLKKN